MTKAMRKVINNAARDLVKILQQLEIQYCFRGELACGAYGLSRAPKALDVLLLHSLPVNLPPIQALKHTITLKSNGPSHFFFDNPKSSSPSLSYRDSTIPGTKKNTCIVYLTYFHNAPLALLRNVNQLTVPPLPYLLLQKLQTWVPSRSFTKKGKPRADAQDTEKILRLLNTYTFEGVHFDQKLFESSKDHVREYRSIFPAHANTWRRLGYEDTPQSPDIVDSPIPRPQPLPSDDTPPGTDTDLPDYTALTRIQMLCLAGKMTIDILKEIGCSGAIFGSLACFLYGTQRSPNDVDVLVLPPDGVIVSMEDIKAMIVELDPAHFFLISARDPQATYRILYFKLTDSLGGLTPRTSCKVDIVAPGTMHLPPLPGDLINWDEGLPLIPFSLLLLQKLQSWDNHRKSYDELKRLKQITDSEDIKNLFELSEIKVLQSSWPWSDQQVFCTEFEALSRDRVKQYCFLFPDSADGWRSIGFETQELDINHYFH